MNAPRNLSRKKLRNVERVTSGPISEWAYSDFECNVLAFFAVVCLLLFCVCGVFVPFFSVCFVLFRILFLLLLRLIKEYSMQ